MAFTFKIKIDGSQKPPIWRKVKVNESVTFDDFHIVIQILFGWFNAHMYQFSPSGWSSTPRIIRIFEDDANEERPISNPDSFPYGKLYDAEKILLKDYFKAEKQKITYIYDFGDTWELIVELIEISDETTLYPVCLSGKGSDVVDDCGGIEGFYRMVDIVNNPKHPEYKSYREWLDMKRGEKWDLNHFDLELTNEMLSEVWRMRKADE